MRSKDFKLSLADGVKNEFIVTAVYPSFEWDKINNQATDKVIGYKLKTVNPSAAYSEAVIKMDGTVPPIDPEEIEKEPAFVTFGGLVFKQYFNNSTGRADFIGYAETLKRLK